MLDKLLGRYLPLRFIMFVLVGAFGVLMHLGMLAVFLKLLQTTFVVAQGAATLFAMTSNYLLNNALTYRDRRLKGLVLARGLILFYAVCAVGAVANLAVADYLFELHVPW